MYFLDFCFQFTKRSLLRHNNEPKVEHAVHNMVLFNDTGWWLKINKNNKINKNKHQ